MAPESRAGDPRSVPVPNVRTKPRTRFKTCLNLNDTVNESFNVLNDTKMWATWNLDLVCRSVFFFGTNEILVLMLVMVCHFYVIFWTWSMLKYDRDRFPFLKPEHVMCSVHEHSWISHISIQQMGFDQLLWFFISPSKMYEIIFTLSLKDILRTTSWFL